MKFTARELARIAVLMLEHSSHLITDSVKLPDDLRTKVLGDAALLQRAAASVITLPPVTGT